MLTNAGEVDVALPGGKAQTSSSRGGVEATDRSYRADIDGLRAIAVCAVLIHHMDEAWMPGAFTGVDIFFVISGYVVAASLLRKSSRTHVEFFLGFYARRVKRLAPTLALTVAATGILLALTVPPNFPALHEYFNSGLFALAGGANLYYAYFTTRDGELGPANRRSLAGYFAAMYGDPADNTWTHDLQRNPFTHAWSLGVEEQFYFLFPLLMLLAYGRRVCDCTTECVAPRARSLLILGGTSAVSFSACYALTRPAPDSAFYLMPSRLWQLAAGAILVDLMQPPASRTPELPSWIARSRGLLLAMDVAATTLIATGFALTNATGGAFPLPFALLPVLGTLIYITAGTAAAEGATASAPALKLLGGRVSLRAPLLNALLRLPPFVYVGKLSYPLYLWHWPIFVSFKWTCGFEAAAQKLAALGLSVAAAAATYHTLEAAVRRWQPKSPLSRPFVLLLPTLAVALWLVTLRDHSSHLYSGDRWQQPGSPTSYSNPSLLDVGDASETLNATQREEHVRYGIRTMMMALRGRASHMDESVCRLRRMLRSMPRQHRRLVMAGDSTMRNQFISLCLAAQGSWWVPTSSSLDAVLASGGYATEANCNSTALLLDLSFVSAPYFYPPARTLEANGWSEAPSAIYVSSSMWLMWPSIFFGAGGVPLWDPWTWRAWSDYENATAVVLEAAAAISPQVAVATSHSVCDMQLRGRGRQAVEQPHSSSVECANELLSGLSIPNSTMRPTFEALYADCQLGVRSRHAATLVNARLHTTLAQLTSSISSQLALVDLFSITDGQCHMNVGNDAIHFNGLVFDENAAMLQALGWASAVSGPREVYSMSGAQSGQCIVEAAVPDFYPWVRLGEENWQPVRPRDRLFR